jgi:hypothetical protein
MGRGGHITTISNKTLDIHGVADKLIATIKKGCGQPLKSSVRKEQI